MTGEARIDHSLDFEVCARVLEGSDQYRVLRRLPPLEIESRGAHPNERVVAIIDTETTGLDSATDEVIEFAGIAFAYSTEGRLIAALSAISQLQEPRASLSEEITRLTGINEAMLKGKTFDIDALDRFIESADLIVAHNASFDRPFCEKISRVFIDKPWACSATEINWSEMGYDGAKLTYLVNSSGWFYDAHRALDDCNALAKVLSSPIKSNPAWTPFRYLLDSARDAKLRISFSAPYALRMSLRQRGFRWKSGQEDGPGKWFADFSERDAQAVLEWLVGNLGIKKAAINVDRMTAFERYR